MSEQTIENLSRNSINVQSSATATRWQREEKAARFESYQRARSEGKSQRESAREADVPLSTARHWQESYRALQGSPEFIAFMTSPIGETFLRQLLLAMVVVFVLSGGCGIRSIGKVLELTGLSAFIASSYGSLQRFVSKVEEATCAFGEEERERLKEGMPEKDITVGLDEHFHGGLTLVGMEPRSNFVLLEERAEKRDGETWAEAIKRSLKGFRVNIIQVTSDEAKGLLKCTEKLLSAHHSPDLFHMVRELSKGVCRPLGKLIDTAKRECEAAPDDLEKAKKLARLEKFREKVRESIRGVGRTYHLANPETGVRESVKEIGSRLYRYVRQVQKVAEVLNLPERSSQLIDKARALIPQMKDTLTFVTTHVDGAIEGLGLTPSETKAVQDELLPASYLRRVAAQTPKKEEKVKLLAKADEIQSALFSPEGALHTLTPEQTELVLQKTQQLADVFQRSSSCVEGRNGALSFRHHQLRSLTPKRRRVITIMHNYFSSRADGTTPAQRFFEQKHRDLFEVLCQRVHYVPAPQTRHRNKSSLSPPMIH